MPMFVWRDRKTDWRIRDSRPKAGMGSTSIVMRDPVLRNDTYVVFRQWNEEVQAFSA
jgi:hypothetical protein